MSPENLSREVYKRKMNPFTPIDVNYILRRLSGEKADAFQQEILYPQLARAMRISAESPSDTRDALAEPYYAFRAMLGYYAFAKRGNDRAEYSGYAMEALDTILSDKPKTNFADFLREREAPQILWEAFTKVCEQHKRKVNEQLNRGLFEGLTDFAQRTFEDDRIGNIWTTIHQWIVRTGRVETIYQEIVEIKGIGPKVGSLLLRDMVALYEMEPHLEPIDYHFLQPVDAWIRRIGPMLTTELDDNSPDWIVAGKLAKACRRNQVSGARFNQGVQYLAIAELRQIEQLGNYLQKLTHQETKSVPASAGR